MNHQLHHFFFNGDIYHIVETSEQLWDLFGFQALVIDEFQVFWTADKRIEIYAVWNVGYMERLRPNTPILFDSNYPTSRFLYIVESVEDVKEFDPKLPFIVSHVSDFKHIPGLRSYGRVVKFAYKIASFNYSWWDYYFGWFYYYFYR